MLWVAFFLSAGAVLAARQSPVDILKKETEVLELPDLEFRHLQAPQRSSYFLENTGQGIQIGLTGSGAAPAAIGGPFGGDSYDLEQVHFHWGRDDWTGSEHLLDGQASSMEAHLVYFKHSYGSYSNASKQSDGLAVVGFFMQVLPRHLCWMYLPGWPKHWLRSRHIGKRRKVQGNKATVSTSTSQCRSCCNDNFQRVVETIPKVLRPSSRIYPPSDLLAWLGPHLKPTGYFTYHGSLTTEPFSENVRWVIFKEPIFINRRQVQAFRSLRSSNLTSLLSYFRPTQDLDGRQVGYVP